MSKSHGPEQTPPETTNDHSRSPTQTPEGFGAIDMSPEGLHDQSLGNSERAARLGLGGGDNTPALSDLNVEDWMNEPEASDVEHAPLPYKSELERGFGADLSGVTVRLGAREELDAQGAEATADGDALSFASTHPDRELVAHEVAHLVQSREHGGSTSARLSDPNEAAEQEADEAAKTVTEGGQAELEEGVTGVMRAKKGPRNNVGKRPDGEDLAARWGVAIQGNTGWIDTFELIDKQLKYFSDGSPYIASGSGNAGQKSKTVQLNHRIAIIGASICIMAHGINGGNFWTPLTNIAVPQDFGRNGTDFRSALLQRVDDNDYLENSHRSSKLKVSKLLENVKALKKVRGDWKMGWDADMNDQRFVLRGSRPRHPADRLRSANMLSDYIPGIKGRPFYLNMNAPKDDVAPIVGDVLRLSPQSGLGKSVYVLDERTTYIWKAGKKDIRGYEALRTLLTDSASNAQRIVDEYPSLRSTLAEKLQNSASGDESEKYRLALVKADLHMARATLRLKQIPAEQKKHKEKDSLPIANRKAGTVSWRFIRLDKVNSRVIEGWVPYVIKL